MNQSKKRILSLVLILSILFGNLSGLSNISFATSSDFEYKETDDGYLITGYNGKKTGEIEIPSIYNDKNVIGIEKLNIFNNGNIESVILPDSLEIPKSGTLFFKNKSKDGKHLIVKVYTDNEEQLDNINHLSIINPASLTINYKDENGKDVKEKETIVGYENKSLRVAGGKILVKNGKGEDISDYTLPLKLGNQKISDLDAAKLLRQIEENYFKIGEEYTIKAPEINGLKPEDQTIKLENKNNEITFIYENNKDNNSDRLGEIIEDIDNRIFSINSLDSDKDKNVIEVLKNKIVNLDNNYEDIEIKILDVEEKEYCGIDENGDINYYYVHPNDFQYNFNFPIKTKFQLSLGDESGELEKNVVINLDKEKYRKLIKEEIINKLDSDIFSKIDKPNYIKNDIELLDKIDYAEIKWESSNSEIIEIKEADLWNKTPSKAVVKSQNGNESVKLIVKIGLIKGGLKEHLVTKEYELTTKEDKNNNELEDMQNLLNENYTEDKLKDYLTKETLDFNNVVNDIKLPTPKETGIKNYDDYKFYITSSNEDIIKPFDVKNAGKLVVYRPLPEESKKNVTLTINMENKKTGKVASKQLKELTVIPLKQEEIEEEIKLMEMVKENYFEIIKGENKSKDEITKDLKWFREVNLSEDGLTWNTHIKDDLNKGITPDCLDGWEDTEKWRLFRSSNEEIISHENLLLTRPKEDTKVTIDSTLTSIVYGKYAEKYKDDERFKKLYKQPVSVELIVKAEKQDNLLDENIKEILPSIENLDYGNLNYLAILSLLNSNKSAEDLKNIRFRENYNSISELAEDIIIKISIGEDPKDEISKLIDSQKTNGDFKISYKNSDDRDLMLAIIALNLYEESNFTTDKKYDKEKSIKLLLKRAKKENNKIYYEVKNNVNEDNIDRSALALIALSRNQKDEDVMEVIKGIKRYFKYRQFKNGQIEGFKYNGEGQFKFDSNAAVIIALKAIGDNPLDEYWTYDGKTLLDGLLHFKVNGGFKKIDSPSSVKDNRSTVKSFAALVDLNNDISIFGKVEKIKDKEEDLNKAEEIKITNKYGKQKVKSGEEFKLGYKVLNIEGKELENIKVDWIVSDENILENKNNGVFKVKENIKEEKEVTITIKTENNLKDTFTLKVIPISNQEIIEFNIEEEIEFLIKCFNAYMEEDDEGNTDNAKLSYIATGAAKLAGLDMDNVRNNIYIDKDNKTAYQLSQSIITLIGAEINPKEYKGRNLVKELQNTQVKEGENKGAFITNYRGVGDDTNSIESQIRSIIALDMAGAEYDKKSAIEYLFKLYNSNSKTYKELETEGYMLVALSNHKDIDGVNDKINSIIKVIKEKQNSDGGFNLSSGVDSGRNVSLATAKIIQGLVANDINPLEDKEWTKNGSTMLNSLLKSKIVKDQLKRSGYGRNEESKDAYARASHTVLAAFMDVKNEKSMFNILRLENEESEYKIVINNDKNIINIGDILDLDIDILDENGNKVLDKKLNISTESNNIKIENNKIKAIGVGKANILIELEGTDIKLNKAIEVTEKGLEDIIEVDLAIVKFNKDGKYENLLKKEKIKIDKNKYNGKVNILNILDELDIKYSPKTGMINEIMGVSPSKDEEAKSSGWMFEVNGEIPKKNDMGLLANQVDLQSGDQIVWARVYNYDKNTIPKWTEIETPGDIDEDKDCKFVFNKEENRIIGYKGEVPNTLVIPSKIDGVEVKHIGIKDNLDQPFTRKNISKLILQEGIETIEQRVFLGNQIEEIQLPSSLKLIRGGAFKENKIKKLILPEGIEEIKAAAFEKNQIEKIIIPSKLLEISDDVFKDNKLKSIEIPENINRIGNGAFASNPIERVDFGKVEIIGNSAFHSTNLKEIELPSSLKEIGMSAFGNTKIEECIIPKSVEEIGRDAFYSKNLNNFTRLYLEDEENSNRLNGGTGVIVDPVELEIINKTVDGKVLSKLTITGQDFDGNYIKNYDRKNNQGAFFIKGNEYGIKPQELEGYKLPRPKILEMKSKNQLEFIYEEGNNSDRTNSKILLVNYDLNEKEFEQVGELIEVNIEKNNPTIVDLLEILKKEYNIDVEMEDSQYGKYITKLGELKSSRANSIMYNINDQKAMLGASSQNIYDGDKIIFYIGNIFNKFEGPMWNDFVKEDEEIKISIKLDNIIKVNQDIQIQVEDNKGNIVDNNDILFLVDNAKIGEISDGVLKTKAPGKLKILASLKDNKDIKTSIEIQVIEENNKENNKIEEIVEDIRLDYLVKDKLTFRELLGFIASTENLSQDLSIVKGKIELRDNDTTANISANIISLVAAGENPYNYNNINYVKLLQNSQKDSGKFLVSGNENYSTNQAFAVIALDMAKAQYKDNTIDMLVNYQKEALDSNNDYKIDELAMGMIALGNHLEDNGVKKVVEDSIGYIRNNYKGKNIWSLSATVQGLISVGEKKLAEQVSEELIEQYIKLDEIVPSAKEQVFIALVDMVNGSSMFKDILYNDNDIEKIVINYNQNRKVYEDDNLHLDAIALDKNNNALVIDQIKWFVDDNSIAEIDDNGILKAKKPGSIKVTAKINEVEESINININKKEFELKSKEKELINNEELIESNILVKNITDESKKVTLIVGLFDKNTNLLESYSKFEKEIKPGEEENLGIGFSIKDKEKYEVKTFIWDDLKEQNIINYKKKAN